MDFCFVRCITRFKNVHLLPAFDESSKCVITFSNRSQHFCFCSQATKDLLLAFSRDFLSGEGILPRHLGYLGLPVSHVQAPLDEFNFAVKSLAVDLKCGIRLV